MDNQPMRESDKNKSAASVSGAEDRIIEGATQLVRDVGEQAKSMVADPVGTAHDLARRTREQAGAATDALYQQGARAGEYLTRNVNEYPLTALLVAGAVGYGMAYLIHNAWQGGAAAGGGSTEKGRRSGDRSSGERSDRHRD